MFRFFLLLILLILLPDAYLWHFFTRPQVGWWRTVLLFTPSVLTLGCMALLLTPARADWVFSAAFVLLVCIIVPKLVFVVFDILARLLTFRHTAAYAVGMRLALCLSVGVAAVQVYGTTFGWHKLRTVKTEIPIAGLPAAYDGYRIVQISDLHLGTYAGDTTYVRRIVDSVNAAHPDLIVFTGDIVNTTSDELPPYTDVLRRLSARDGVFSILGNHDYCLYGPGFTPAERKWHVERIVSLEREMGWHVLLNESQMLHRGSDSLAIAGVENVGKPPFPRVGKLEKALKKVSPQTCTLLLSHDPWHWRHGVIKKTKVALTLSGHTHALQLQIGNFSPAQWIMPEWGGLYAAGRQRLYVSTGLGGTIPYRLGAWPKVEMLTLRTDTPASLARSEIY